MNVTNMNKIQDIYDDNLKFMKSVLNSTYDVVGKGQVMLINLLKPAKRSTRIVRKDYNDEPIEDIQSKGDRFLSELYALSKADQNKGFNMYEIGERIGFAEFETEEIVNNLSRAELVKRNKPSEDVFLTPYGIMINNRDIIVGYAPVH
jgi:hypothetical protein